MHIFAWLIKLNKICATKFVLYMFLSSVFFCGRKVHYSGFDARTVKFKSAEPNPVPEVSELCVFITGDTRIFF